MEKEVSIEWVRVERRFRKDLGDLDSLAKSIDREGLIHAIAVTPDGQLLAGQRRLEAHKLLGRTTIQARFIDNIADAVARLRVERDENVERKEMLVSERVALAKTLEALEADRIAMRKHADSVRAGKIRQGSLKSARGSTEPRAERAREIAGRAVGLGGSSYFKARKVVEAADDLVAPPEDQAIARAAVADMDATGNIAGNYEKVRKRRDVRLSSRPKTTVDDAKGQRRAIAAAVNNLSGLAYGIRQIEAIHPEITNNEAAQWVDDLVKARAVISSLINRLKERTSA